MTEQKPSVDDLFGEESLPADPQPEAQGPRFPFPIPQGGLAIGGGVLAVIIFFWWSSSHRDNYYIELDDGRVTIEQGWFFLLAVVKYPKAPRTSHLTCPVGSPPRRPGADTDRAG